MKPIAARGQAFALLNQTYDLIYILWIAAELQAREHHVGMLANKVQAEHSISITRVLLPDYWFYRCEYFFCSSLFLNVRKGKPQRPWRFSKIFCGVRRWAGCARPTPHTTKRNGRLRRQRVPEELPTVFHKI